MKRSKCRSRMRTRTKRDENRSRWRRSASGKRVRWVEMIGRVCRVVRTIRIVHLYIASQVSRCLASIEVNP